MTKIVPGFYESPAPKKEVEMDERELKVLFERLGGDGFKKWIRFHDIETTMSGAKFAREMLMRFKEQPTIKTKKKRKQIIRGNLRKI